MARLWPLDIHVLGTFDQGRYKPYDDSLDHMDAPERNAARHTRLVDVGLLEKIVVTDEIDVGNALFRRTVSMDVVRYLTHSIGPAKVRPAPKVKASA